MGTILDYLSWRGDIRFSERPLNEVDNLILSEIVYFEFSDVMTDGKPISLEDAYQRYVKLEGGYSYATNNPIPLFEAASQTERFKNIMVSDFVDIIDNDRGIQFAAATFTLDDGTIFICFRGTDNTIVGWREDFNQSFLDESPAQAEAVKYLKRALAKTDKNVIVGGHSKGGNLSVYASAFCGMSKRIDIIYSNDGPGFNEYISSKPDYQNILPKVSLIMPEASIVAILYLNKADKKVIQSTETAGNKQHSPYSWLIDRDHFVLAEKQSSSSLLFDETFNSWLSSMDDTERENFVTTIFDSLDASGASTLAEMGENKLTSYNAIKKAMKELNSDSKEAFMESLKKLVLISRDNLISDAKKKFEADK